MGGIFGLKRENVTKIYRRLLFINSYATPPLATKDMRDGFSAILTGWLNS
jgi:hypothetical protein